MGSSKLKEPYPQLWFVCKFCRRAFQRRRKLIAHKKTNHGLLLDVELKTNRRTQNGKEPPPPSSSSLQSSENKTESLRKPKPKADEPVTKKIRSDVDYDGDGDGASVSGHGQEEEAVSTGSCSTTPSKENAISALERNCDRIHRPSDARVLLMKLTNKQLEAASGGTKRAFENSTKSEINPSCTKDKETKESVPSKVFWEVISPKKDRDSNESQPVDKDHQELIEVNVSTSPGGSKNVKFSKTVVPRTRTETSSLISTSRPAVPLRRSTRRTLNQSN